MRPFFKTKILWNVTNVTSSSKPLVMTVNLTSTSFILPFSSPSTGPVKIDWGDGSSSVGTAGNNIHVYSTIGTYTINVYANLFSGIYFNNTGSKYDLKKVTTFGDTISSNLAGMFYGCSINTCDLSSLKHTATNASNMFKSTPIQNISLFDLSGVTNTSGMFFNCNALTTVPLFDLSSVTDASYMFSGCSALTTVPLFNLSSLTNATQMFSLYSVTTFPLFDLSNVTVATSMFQNCQSLITIPPFNLSKVTNASQMFALCPLITSVPLLTLNTTTSWVATQMFALCPLITTIPLLNLSKVTNATNMFQNCTLDTTNYSDFLIHLATLPLQNNVTFGGGNSKYNTAGGNARAYLISQFNWTISDGGPAP